MNPGKGGVGDRPCRAADLSRRLPARRFIAQRRFGSLAFTRKRPFARLQPRSGVGLPSSGMTRMCGALWRSGSSSPRQGDARRPLRVNSARTAFSIAEHALTGATALGINRQVFKSGVDVVRRLAGQLAQIAAGAVDDRALLQDAGERDGGIDPGETPRACAGRSGP